MKDRKMNQDQGHQDLRIEDNVKKMTRMMKKKKGWETFARKKTNPKERNTCPRKNNKIS